MRGDGRMHNKSPSSSYAEKASSEKNAYLTTTNCVIIIISILIPQQIYKHKYLYF